MSCYCDKFYIINKKHNVAIYHKPYNSIHEQLVRTKDKNKEEQQSDMIYKKECGQCKDTYMVLTARSLGTRFDEHIRTNTSVNPSSVPEHITKTGHRIDLPCVMDI